jgi:transcriptional regulator with XRE-family HTH domain
VKVAFCATKYEGNDFMLQITLRAARITCGYTEDEVAKYCRASIRVIEEVELDSGEMPYNLLLKISDLYDVDLDRVYLGPESDCYHEVKS